VTLTQLAFQFLTLGAGTRMAILGGVILLGGLVSLIGARPTARLARAPYFALATGLHFTSELLNSTIFANQLGKVGLSFDLGVSQLLSVLVLFAFGFFWGRLALARSRDIFGSGKFAYIAFVPLLGYLWFIFAPAYDRHGRPESMRADSQPPAVRTEQPFVLQGGSAIVLGLAFMLALAVVKSVDREATREVREFVNTIDVENLEDNPAFQPDYALMIRLGGLESLLQSIVAAERPSTIEPGFDFRGANLDGKTLSYVYAIEALTEADTEAAEEVVAGITGTFCADKDFLAIVEAGGTIEVVLLGSEDAQLALGTVAEGQCPPEPD
jgi:hypothetical protein